MTEYGFNLINDLFLMCYGCAVKEAAKGILERYAYDFGEDEVVIAVEIACEKYSDPVTAFKKIGGILYNRKNDRQKYFKYGENEVCEQKRTN